MSFVLFNEQLDNKFDLTLKKAYEEHGMNPPRLRGNTWADVLVPPYQHRSLPFGIIGLQYARAEDLVKAYNNRKSRVRDVPAVRGAVLHACILRCLEQTRRYLMRCRTPNRIDIPRKIQEIHSNVWKLAMKEIPRHSSAIRSQEKLRIRMLALQVLEFECSLLASRIRFMVSRNPAITRDTLVESVPFQVEPTLSVPDMAFFDQLKPDLVWPAKHAVGEIKTGRESKSHLIDLAGYALALEKQQGDPVDIGFILYLDVDKSYKVPAYRCVVHSLDDTYRRLFIERRNDALRILSQHLPQTGS